MENFPVYLITGLSGAGKSQAIKAFEDIGLYCVDNLPPQMVEQFLEFWKSRSEPLSGVAFVVDVRGEGFIKQFPQLLRSLKRKNIDLTVLFLEASSEVLLNRYKESRRPHPLGEEFTLKQAIEAERDRLMPVRDKAGFVFDTSQMTIHQFRGMLMDLYGHNGSANFTISLTSFGFKYGVPAHVDTLFDARFLRNPYYDSDLKDLSGIDRSVEAFFKDSEAAENYLEKLIDLLNYLVGEYEEGGKNFLSVGIGCTGGRHRSVYLVRKLSTYFEDGEETRTIETHRDLETLSDGEREVRNDN